MRRKEQGITLIALVVTIIVMLILVGVTVNVAIQGRLFGSAKKASYQTEIRTIQEQLEGAKATKVIENKGIVPLNYGITMDNLTLSEQLKSKYSNKLVVSRKGILCYNSEVVTNAEERAWLEEIGVNEYFPQDKDLVVLEEYFLGENGEGKDLMSLVESLDDLTNIKFKDDPNTRRG